VDALGSECPPQRRCEATVTSNGSDLWGTIIRRTSDAPLTHLRRTSEGTQRALRGHSEGTSVCTQRALRGHSEVKLSSYDLWSSPFSLMREVIRRNQPRTCDLWSSPFSRFGVMTASVGSGPHTRFFRSPRQSTGFGRPPLLRSSRTRHRIGLSANSNSGEPSCPTAPDEGGNQQSSAVISSFEFRRAELPNGTET